MLHPFSTLSYCIPCGDCAETKKGQMTFLLDLNTYDVVSPLNLIRERSTEGVGGQNTCIRCTIYLSVYDPHVVYVHGMQ